MNSHRMGSAILAIVLSAVLVESGCNVNWINMAVGDIPVVLDIVTSILGIVAIAQGKGQADPGMVAEVQNIGAQAKADLTTVQKLVNDYKTAATADKPGVLGKIDAALSAAKKDLEGILVAFHVKDATTQTAIASGVGLAIATVDAIYSLLPPAPPSTIVPNARAAKKSPPHQPRKPEDLKNEYNAIVSPDFPDAVIH
jgi:hypothetical protein